jgi:RNA polymerase sigma-70 factor (ECF subfamily)
VSLFSIHGTEKLSIRKAAKGDRRAQQWIYDRYSSLVLSVCRQYIRDMHYAEDVMVMSFTKVFTHLDDFQHKGSFEGWIRRIAIRESISFLRKKQFVVYDEKKIAEGDASATVSSDQMEMDYLQRVIDQLPEGYKVVFVLHSVEGYTHPEISELLGISVGTSKSQLFKARKMMQELLGPHYMEQNGTKNKSV